MDCSLGVVCVLLFVTFALVGVNSAETCLGQFDITDLIIRIVVAVFYLVLSRHY